MKPIVLIATALGMAAFTVQPGFADCVDVTGSVNKEARGGISKDGTHAPLEGGANTQAQSGGATGTTTTSADAGPNAPQKDGGANLPMGESTNLATSNQDVSAQQDGGKTAAEVATQDKCD